MSARWFTGLVGAVLIAGAFLFGLKTVSATDQGFSASCGDLFHDGHSPVAAQEDTRVEYQYSTRTDLSGMCVEKVGVWNTGRYVVMGAGLVVLVGAVFVRASGKQ